MKRWTVFSALVAGTLLFATGAQAHSYGAAVISQPISGTVQHPTPSSFYFRGVAAWVGEVDGEILHAVYRCTADGTIEGSFAASGVYGGTLDCTAETLTGQAPSQFSVPVTGSVDAGIASMHGRVNGFDMDCDGFSTASLGAIDVSLGCLLR